MRLHFTKRNKSGIIVKMTIYEHNQIMDMGRNDSPSPNNNKQKIVIIVLSCLCAALLAAIIVFGIIFAVFNNTKHVPQPVYSTEQLCEKVLNQVVRVESAGMKGSGVIVSLGGKKYIITNHHVIKSGGTLKVTFNDANEYVASLMGFDAYHDIALLSVEGDIAIDAASIDESGSVKTGEYVLAIGNNLVSGIAVFDGIMSRTSQMITQKADNKTVPVYQITAAVNAGMSGGGLYNNEGLLIAINTYQQTTWTDDRPVDGVSYSVPMSIAAPIIRQIYKQNIDGSVGQIARIAVQNPRDVLDEVYFSGLNFRAKFTKDGLVATPEGSNAEMIGGAIESGDIISSIGGMSITNQTTIVQLFSEVLKYTHNPELTTKNLKITLLRDGKQITITYDNKKLKNY